MMRAPREPHELKSAIAAPPLPLRADRALSVPGSPLVSFLWQHVKAQDEGWRRPQVQSAVKDARYHFVSWAKGERAWLETFRQFESYLQEGGAQ